MVVFFVCVVPPPDSWLNAELPTEVLESGLHGIRLLVTFRHQTVPSTQSS